MRRLTDCLVAVFLSPEILVILVAIIAGFALQAPIRALGARLEASTDAVRFLALIPVALLGLMAKDRNKLLLPRGKGSDVLQEWPGHYMLADRFHIGLAFEALAACVALLIWAFHAPLAAPHVFVLFFGGIGVGLTTYAHFYHATYTIRRILSNELSDPRRTD